MNKIGRYIEDSIFKLGPTEKANNKKTSKKTRIGHDLFYT